MPEPLIILGASARAAAVSAIRAGYLPWCIDRFADRDLRELAPVKRCPPEQYPGGMLRLLDDAPAGAPILLTGAMENYPDLLRALTFEHPLLHTSIDAIQRVRDPLALPSLQPARKLQMPRVRTRASLVGRLTRLIFGNWGRTRWLIKPIRSGGGSQIRWFTPGTRVPRDHYLQQYIRGTAYSAVFHTDGWSARLLGITEQLVGESDFHAPAFAYCGSIGPVQLTEQARTALAHLAVEITQRFDLRGIFGIDFIMDWRGHMVPVEINPRHTASIEVIERATGRALLDPALARRRVTTTQPDSRVHGKAILFADRPVRVADFYDHCDAGQIADVPEVASEISAHEPICTIFAAERSVEACRQRLIEQARHLYRNAIS